MPEGACIFVDFDQVNEMAGVSAHGFGFRPAQIQLAESQSAAENAARSAQSLVAGRRIDRQMKRSPFNRCVGVFLGALGHVRIGKHVEDFRRADVDVDVRSEQDDIPDPQRVGDR